MMAAIDREESQKSESPSTRKNEGAICSTSSRNYSKPDSNNQLSFSDVRVAAYGQWEYIHTALGVKIISTDYRKHTACCGCGGKDRFRVMADYGNTGKWFCGGGGDQQSGDGFSLLGHVFGWDSKQQLKAVADVLGLSQMDNKERDKIRAIAEKQSAQMALDAQRKHEQARRDYNIKTIAEDLIDAIKHREYLQRQTNKVDGRYVFRPSIDEIALVKELITHSIESYGEYLKPEVNHA
ncbi:MAG: hypothetical protein L3K52_09855 [Candidatus Thiothrix sulfatifontis]|nr:MAG: hypothetical protein L3K52_09855 [Candidatus Thiothrix sulfatifontis]